MRSDRPTLEDLAAQMARSIRRSPEFRMRPGRPAELGPIRLLGIVGGYAVYRGSGGTMPRLTSLMEFDKWPLCDKDGVVFDGQ